MLAPAGNRIKFICLCLALNCLANFQDAYPNSYPNTAYESFENFTNQSYIDRGDENGLTEFQFTWIWSAILNVWAIGYFIGSFSTPFFAEKYGRKATMVMSNLGSLVGTSLAVISVSCGVPELLFVARLCSAVMSGISYSALILFLQETTPTEIRGMTSFMSETAYLSVSVLGMGLGMQNVLGRKLPILIGIHAIAAITAVAVMVCVQETPKYLLINRKDANAAIKSLEYYNGLTITNAKVIESIKKEAEEGHEAPFLSSIPLILKTRHLKQAFLVGFCSMQIMLTIIPINYVSTIVLKAHFSSQMAQVSSFAFILCNFVASIFGMFAVDRFGRRPMLLLFGALNVFFLCSYCVFDRLAVYANEQFKYGCVISLVGYGITYGGALGPIAFFITSELVPQQFRSAVQAMVYSANTVFNFTFGFCTLPLYKLIDVWSFIPLFIVPSMLALIYLFFNLPETKGREIHEIVRELAGGRFVDGVALDQKLDICKDEKSDHL